MCDEDTVRDNDRFLNQQALSRRSFNRWMVAGAATVTAPLAVGAPALADQEVRVPTADGEADCYFVHPATGRYPGVVIWPDILSLRPAFRAMAQRLAQQGYAVLVINPYYRQARAPVVAPGAGFQDGPTRATIMPLARSLSAATTVTDGRAMVSWLDSQPAVDTARGIGTMGYCMGGPMTMRTAAAIPARIRAAASFHGGRLVTDGADSPHLLIPQMQAQYLIAIAENDHERNPQVQGTLVKAFADAGLKAEIEVYAGTLHGWCPPDSRVYNEAQAERAWSRLLALFRTALA